MTHSAKKRKYIYKRDGNACLKCGSKPPEVRLTLDHIHPKGAGGHNGKRNLQTLCEKCNLEKGCTYIDYRKNSPKHIRDKKLMDLLDELAKIRNQKGRALKNDD